jgi:hypothetical protein
MKWLVLICMALTSSATSVHAAEMREIELSDGSIIAGEIVSLSRGVYTIKSATLGTVQIEEAKIRVIRQKGPSGTTKDQMKSLQDKMISSDEIMNMIRSLQNDQDFLQILNDPEIMKAVQSGDISALMANQQFMNLLNKQSVQQIKNKMSQ